MSSPALFTEEEVAKQLGVSSDTLWRWRRKKKIPFRKLGRKIRYTPGDVAEIIEGAKEPSRSVRGKNQ